MSSYENEANCDFEARKAKDPLGRERARRGSVRNKTLLGAPNKSDRPGAVERLLLLNHPHVVMFRSMSEKKHVVIAVPYGYSHRDQLVGFIQSQFTELEISVVHQDISKPEVGSAEVDYDASASPEEILSNDARSVMGEVADALSKFSR